MNKLLLGTAAILLSVNALAQEGGALNMNGGLVTKPSK